MNKLGDPVINIIEARSRNPLEPSIISQIWLESHVCIDDELFRPVRNVVGQRVRNSVLGQVTGEFLKKDKK